MTEALQGGAAVSAFAIAIFFLRFYRVTGDVFHQLFAAAFALFGVNRVMLVLLEDKGEGGLVAYAIRAAAFMLILAAILHKNRARAS